MAMCIALARKGIGYVSPNPLVGAVLVRSGRVVARGYHHRFGGPHAEVECLQRYRGPMTGTVLYVNLEPCSHFGKTPPCADLIIERGVSRVVVGMTDPNPLVSGRGIRKLRRAGIRVDTGILTMESEELNFPFCISMRKMRPFVHVKVAQTLDGKIARTNNRPSRISGNAAATLVHRWRSEHDAILVGAGTIRSDNPRLTVRKASGRDPAVVVVDGKLTLNARHRVFASARRRRVYLICDRNAMERNPGKVRALSSRGVIVSPLTGNEGRISPQRILEYLHKQNIGSILVEGGANIFGQFASKRYCDRLSVIIAPRIFGSGVAAFDGRVDRQFLARPFDVNRDSLQKIGSDYLIQYTS
jgi:diaminohydroxyphosphoribosylaminopyrimidine deaminase / 5-amino-6-(5-phosphoribosylamino)uracil reductase